MESFTGTGVFWIDGRDSDRVTGTLTFTTEDGVRLDLIGSFGGEAEAVGRHQNDDDAVRILGVAGKAQVTLVEAVQSGFQIEVPGIIRESYRADVLITGAHITASDGLEFQSVLVRVQNLPVWVARSGLSLSVTAPEGEPPSRIVYDFTPIAPERVPLLDGGQLEVGFSWSMGGDRLTEAYIRQDTYIEVRPAAPVTLNGVFQTAGAIRSLLTLAANVSCSVEEVLVRHAAFARAGGPEGGLKGLTIHARLEDARPEGGNRKIGELLFTYEQLGGAAGVAGWLGLAEELRPVLGSLMTLRYAGGLYAENRMQNVALAAESLHRIRFPNEVRAPEEHERLVGRVLNGLGGDDRRWLAERLTYSNEPNLRRRLRDLVDFAGVPFVEFVGDGKRWAHVIADVRNQLTHFQGKEPEIDGLYYLSESVYVLVMLCLLRMAGASEELLASVPQNRHVAWLKGPVRASVAASGGKRALS